MLCRPDDDPGCGQNVGQLTSKYKAITILSRRINALYGKKIEQIKMTFTVFTVICSYVAVRYYDRLSLYFLLFCSNVLIFTYTLPPLLYYEAYKVHENSVTSKKMLTRATANSCDRVMRLLERKVIKSLKPLEVRVAGMYFLDRMMAPLYLRIIFSYTCTVLLTN